MRKAVFCISILLLIATLMSCSPIQGENESLGAGASEAALVAPPSFKDFDTWLKNAQNSKWYYGEVGYFYMPFEIPEGLVFKEISPGGKSPTFWYNSKSKDLWKYDPNMFSIHWYTPLIQRTDDLETRVKGIVEPLEYTRVGNYYVTECPAKYYRTMFEGDILEYNDEEILFKMVFWEQGNDFFKGIVPATFTQEDIEKYCVAKKVEVKQ
jgi:hypothetical protein